MRMKFELRRFLALLLAVVMVATNLGSSISAKAEAAERVTVDLKNVDGKYGMRAANIEDTTYDGVNVIKVEPDGVTNQTIRFDYHDGLKKNNLSAATYKYAAVDYYYAVENADENFKNMELRFYNGVFQSAFSTQIVTNQWARVIFDFTNADLSTFFQKDGGIYSHLYFFLYGADGNNCGNTAKGTMYINNLSFYTAKPGQPEVTGISFATDNLQGIPGDSVAIPKVKASGNNDPVSAYELELSGNSSSSTRIDNGKLYIGADETSETITLTAKSCLDATKTATCIVTVEEPAECVTVDLKNADGKYGMRAAKIEDTTYDGVNVIKVEPDGTSNQTIRFDYSGVKNRNLSASTYQYAAVDYYYAVEEENKTFNNMELRFYNGVFQSAFSTQIVTNQWARVIFDLTDDNLSTFFAANNGMYSHLYFFLYGATEPNNYGNTAKGTMYINNLSFYTSEPGQPEVESISFSEKSLSAFTDGSFDVPTVTVTGENYPHAAHTLELSGQSSENTTIGEDRKLHIGSDEASETLTITAKSVLDETKTDTCTVAVEKLDGRVTVDLKNENGYDKNDMGVDGDATYNGVDVIQVAPKAGDTTTRSRFNYWLLRDKHLNVSAYKYVAVDYYYDVTGVADAETIADDMALMFADYTNGQNQTHTVEGTGVVTGQWARIIFDLTGDTYAALSTMYSDTSNEYNQMYFYPYGKHDTKVAAGTMYINNVSFYTSNPGQPEITDISFSDDSLTAVLGNSHDIPTVTATGKNYPIGACDLEVSGHRSKDTYIRDGKIYIGADEKSKSITITAKAVSDPTKTATCTVTVVETTIPSGDPEYMAKMIGTYVDADGVTKQWKEVYQNISGIEAGKTYEFSFNYYVPEEGTVQARIMGEGWKVLGRAVSKAGEVRTMKATYTAKEGDKWLAPLISKDTEGIAYVWNLCFNEAGGNINLLENGDFTEGEGSWIGWTIGGKQQTDKAGSDSAIAAVGHEIIKYDKTLLKKVQKTSPIPSGDPTYMAKMIGTYVDANGVKKQWKEVWQTIYEIEPGKTYEFTFNYFLPEDGDVQARIMRPKGEDAREIAVLAVSKVGEVRTLKATYTAKAGDKWLQPLISKNTEGIAYVWNMCFKEVGGSVNLLENAAFTEGDGSWIGWNIAGKVQKDKAGSDNATATVGHEIVKFDRSLFKRVMKTSPMPSGDPKYMAKMIGTYVDANGVKKQWKEVWQTIYEIEPGKTYEFTFNYFLPEDGDVQARIMRPKGEEEREVAVLAVSKVGEVGTLKATYTAKAGDKWLQPLISKNTEGIAYVWNMCFKEVGGSVNLLENAAFTEGDGSWIGWNISGKVQKDKAGSDNATATVGHEIVKFDKSLFKRVVKTSPMPSGDPEYMAKMIGTYVDANGVTKQWKEVYQNIFEIEAGKTYEFSFNYFVPGSGSVQARIMGEGWKVLERDVSETGEVGTLKATYTAQAGDKWLAPLISKDTEGVAYVWNMCFNIVGEEVNLLENAAFTEGDGSWIGWTIAGKKQKDKAGSDSAIAAVGHEIVKFDKKLFEREPGNASALNSAINPNYNFDFAENGKYKALDTWPREVDDDSVQLGAILGENGTKIVIGVVCAALLAGIAIAILVVKKKTKNSTNLE